MIDYNLTSKVIAVIGLYLFLPITASTYYMFRQQLRKFEVERVLSILQIDPHYRKVFAEEKPGLQFLWAVAYTSVVSIIGLSVLLLGSEIFRTGGDGTLGEFPTVSFSGVEFPQKGSRLVAGMAFLGAYLWGLQYIFRRYSLNDLTSNVYYGLSMRMIFSALIALVLYNAYAALAGGGDSQGGVTPHIWPSLAFLLGMFPQRGVRWLTERVPVLSSESNPAVRETPLEMIEGIETHDKIRLEELGLDTCYDLATADFVPLVLNTPYSSRQLVDWILQAKLCVYFGDAVKELREHSIRTIVDLQGLKPEEIEALAPDIALTKSALEKALISARNDVEIGRLRKVAQLLGVFSHLKDELEDP